VTPHFLYEKHGGRVINIERQRKMRKRVEMAYRKEREHMLRYAERHVNREEAEDILHDVFLNALRSLDAMEPIHNVAAWLFTALKNRIMDWYRRKQRSQGITASLSERLVDEVVDERELSPFESLWRAALEDELEFALGELPASEREVIQRNVFCGETFESMAKATGTSINTLMGRKRYAIERLRAALEEYLED
jgi:RNA polymerase sigma factor (sigma-70 family)